MAIIDISRTLSPQTATWPGDRAFKPSWTLRLDEGDAVNVGAISLSLHTGTHVDAPLHVDEDGAAVTRLPLDAFIGSAVTGREVIRRDMIDQQAVSLPPRVLFKTASSHVSTHTWSDDFPSIAPAAIEWLSEQGVVLIGTDAPSVDPANSTALKAHHALKRCGIVNLEGLFLRDVDPGMYQLVAFPLKLEGMDASPVRAVLIDAA